MIRREHYLAQIRPFADNDLIKVITGIRRCGKSTILQQLSEDTSLKRIMSFFLNSKICVPGLYCRMRAR